jgi:hypothetical protein
MKNIFLTVIGLIYISGIYCQKTTFEFILSTPKNETLQDVYEDNNGNIYFTGFVTRPNEMDNNSLGLVVKIDDQGCLLDSIIPVVNNKRYCIINILPDGNDQFVLIGYSSDAINGWPYNDNINIEVKKINNDLNITESKSYMLPPDYSYWNMLTRRGRNNNFLIAGTVFPYNIPYMFIYVLNESLDSLKANIYTDKVRTCYAIHQLNDSTYWVVDGLIADYFSIDDSLNLTSLGQVPEQLTAAFGIKWDTDTSFYMTGEWNGGPDDDIGFFKQFHPFDTTNYIFNDWGTIDTLDFPASWDALDFNNKDSIYIGGTTGFGNGYFNYHQSWYFIIQTDSNLNIRWERFYGGGAYYEMQKIIASNDGGCIVAGTRYDYQNATEEELDIHILKLNSEGLLVGTHEEPTIEIHEALVFPNPGTNYLKVRVAAQYKHSTFDLFDMNGNKVLSQQIKSKWAEVNTTFLQAGTYIYNIYNSEGLFESGKWVKQ